MIDINQPQKNTRNPIGTIIGAIIAIIIIVTVIVLLLALCKWGMSTLFNTTKIQDLVMVCQADEKTNQLTCTFTR